MIDLTAIAPLTEAESDAYFNKPSTFERYEAAMVNIRTCVGQEETQAVEQYVQHLKKRINASYATGRSEAWMRPGNGEMGG